MLGGGENGYALKNDGTIWSWGSDNTGQLGDGGTNTNSPTPVSVAINTTGNDVFVSSTANESIIDTNGTDFYVFRGAFGNDVINDTGGSDRLDLMDFAYGDYFTRIEGGTNGDNLVITLTGGTITIVNYFAEIGNIAGTGYIEAIDFWNTQNVTVTTLAANGWV